MALKSPLLFGNETCVVHRDPQAFCYAMTSLWPRLEGCDANPEKSNFACRTAALLLPGLSLLATQSTSLRVHVADNTKTSIAILMQGQVQLQLQRQSLFIGSNASGVFVPAGSGPQFADAHDQHVLMLQIERKELEIAARAVFGYEDDRPVDIRFDQPLLLDGGSSPSLISLAGQIGATVNSYAQSAELLHRIGFQDFVYRQLVLHIKPDCCELPIVSTSKLQRDRAVDRVCDLVLADLEARYTVSQMAEVANLSVRGLQYAFMARFGQSPTAWLINQRLDRARRGLLGGMQDTFTKIAMDCGFATASSFSALYRRRFGETPTETRARSL